MLRWMKNEFSLLVKVRNLKISRLVWKNWFRHGEFQQIITAIMTNMVSYSQCNEVTKIINKYVFRSLQKQSQLREKNSVAIFSVLRIFLLESRILADWSVKVNPLVLVNCHVLTPQYWKFRFYLYSQNHNLDIISLGFGKQYRFDILCP